VKVLARVLAAALLLAAVAGCAGVPLPAGCRGQVEYRLYFGADSPSGEVSAAQWAAFLQDSLTPRFPEGLTVYNARGQWRDGNGRIAGEETHVVEILRDGTPDDDARVATVAREYRERFNQESVLSTRKPARACF
jgi:hypothetical protein